MKKALYASLFFICLFILTACGADDNTLKNQGTESEYYNIRVEEEEIFSAETQPGSFYYGIQFYGGEIVQVMEDITRVADKGISALLLRDAGLSETLLPKYSFFTGRWFLTSDGQSILFYDEYYGGGIHVLNQKGEKLFSVVGVSGLSVCETEDGKIYLLALDETEENVFIAELNIASGALRRLEGLNLNRRDLNFLPPQCLGSGPEGLMYMDGQGIWKIEDGEDKANKTLWLSFENTTYMDMSSNLIANPTYLTRDATGFRILEDGSVEILWSFQDSGRGLIQVLKAEQVEKEIIRLRCTQISGWLAQCIAQFNQNNENYYIIPEQPAREDTDTLKDFQQHTDLEIGAGKGADLIIGQASYDFYALLKNGALEDLAPYLERSGINREDYFPAAFAQEKEQGTIYGIIPEISLMDLWISSDVMGTAEEQNIETIVDALNVYSEKGSVSSCPPREILMCLLKGSADFWGMVDYEQTTCEFDTELFRKILNVAKRYSAQSYRDSDPIIDYRYVHSLLYFTSEAELNAQGKTDFGFIFDDGVYSPVSWHQVLAINSNSTAKEACWEFIALLLQEENQQKMIANPNTARLPTSRKVFVELQEYFLELSSENADEHLGFCTEEEAAEQLELMESLHMYPLGTEYIQDIIWDEAQDYFNDLKPIEAIIENINNRVQLYLDEQ